MRRPNTTSTSATSETIVPIARNTDPAAAQPATRYKSRARSASSMRTPSPGHDVTASTANDPLSSAPTTRPYTAAAGRSAGFRASRHTIRARGMPRANAARTYGCPTTSAIACDCMRSNIAAIGNASAVAGTIKWRRTSRKGHAVPPADRMSPTGSQPVPAATANNTSDERSGGRDKSTIDTVRIVSASGPRRLPLMMPSGRPMSVAATSAVAARMAVLIAPSRTSPLTGDPYIIDRPKSSLTASATHVPYCSATDRFRPSRARI